MPYKLIAIDCDNTLLDKKGNIPEENKRIIKILNQKGIEIIIATGRNDILVYDYIKELDIKAPVIGCNGASIRELNSGKILSITPIKKSALKEIFLYSTKNNLPFKAFTMKKGFSNDKMSVELGINAIMNTYTKALAENIKYEYITDTQELVDEEEIIKVVFVEDNPKELERIKQDIACIADISVVRSARNCIDICDKTVSKGNALEKYATSLSIDLKDTIAIGDSENDYYMLKKAGFSVAMENGEDSLKEIADMVTLSNDNCGVSFALKKIFSLE